MVNIGPGQAKFYSYIMERAREDKQKEAKALLEEGFRKQSEGSFNAQYVADTIPKLLSMIKSEYVMEVKNILTQFGSSLKS